MAKYYVIKEKAIEVKKKYNNRWIANTVGISYGYISLILNGKKSCPKTVAYSLTKAIDENAEISDYFYQEEV